MIDSWTASGDFLDVVDTLEPLTLYRRGGDPAGAVTRAWRFREASSDPLNAGGSVRVIDTTWQVSVEEGSPPRVGDRVHDAEGACGVVRSVRRMRGGTRWLCGVRRTQIAPLLSERLRLERLEYETGSQDPELSGWRVIAHALTALIMPFDSETTADHRVVAASSTPAEEGDRFIRSNGEILVVVTTPDEHSLGDPSVFQTAKQVDPS